MKLLLTSDLQLGGAIGYGTPEQPRLADNAETLVRILEVIDEHDVELVIVAGDVFQHRKPAVDELLAFSRWLSAVPCEVAIVAGNHDVRGPLVPASIELFESDRDAPVRTFTRPDFRVFRSMLERPDVAVGFLPWAHPATIRARLDGDREALAEALIGVAAGLWEDVASTIAAKGEPDTVPMLVTHHALDGASLPMGLPVRELMAETVLDTGALLEQGWRYVFAGHVHSPGLCMERAGAEAHSIGPPWRHDHGEASITPNVVLYDSTEDRVTRIALEDRAFVTLDLTAKLPSDDAEIAQALGPPVDLNGAIVRVRVSGPDAKKADVAAIRRNLTYLGAHVITGVALNVEATVRARSEKIADAGGPMEELEAYIEANFAGEAGMRADELRGLTAALLEEER